MKKWGKTALEIGANTFQFFTGNPRGGRVAELAQSDVKALTLLMEKNNFGDILAHAPYTINMASHKPHTWEFAKETMRRDLRRLGKLPCPLYNFRPENHTGKETTLLLETPNDLNGYKREIEILRKALNR
jgi:deoxyribonuclease-4